MGTVAALAQAISVLASVTSLVVKLQTLMEAVQAGLTPEQREDLQSRLQASRDAKEALRDELGLGVDVLPDPPGK